jgi:hypothetical protein
MTVQYTTSTKEAGDVVGNELRYVSASNDNDGYVVDGSSVMRNDGAQVSQVEVHVQQGPYEW